MLGAAPAFAIARNGFEASFVEPALKARWAGALEAAFREAAAG